MVSFVNFYFHFPANFQTKTSPHMFSIFFHVAHAVSLGYLWFVIGLSDNFGLGFTTLN